MKKKIIGTIIIICLILSFILTRQLWYSKKSTYDDSIFVEDDNAQTVKTEKTNNQAGIKVYVNGEVKSPGVYTLDLGSRVEEAVIKAGGLTENADRLSVNMAKKLKDEDYIIIENKNSKTKVSNSPVTSVSLDNGKIDINSATKEQLKTVPGIGDITAQKILDYIAQNGPLKTMEDLKKVGRIGDKTIEKMKDKIEVR